MKVLKYLTLVIIAVIAIPVYIIGGIAGIIHASITNGYSDMLRLLDWMTS